MRRLPGSLRRIEWLAAGIAFSSLVFWVGPAASGGSVCGNGMVEGTESCDDGNTAGCDGCGPFCVPDECGDAVLCLVTEECDDGNTDDGDGCALDCTCEPELCGDGIRGCTEECDDANTIDGDGCESDCTWTVPCTPTTRLQKACIRAMNRSLAGVVDAQNADDAACVRNVAAGKTLTVDDCLGEDVADKVARAEARTTSTDGKKCQPPKGETPPLAYTAPATVNGAGKVEPLEAAASVLGLAPNVVAKSSDAAGAACQAEVMKQLGALATRWAAEAIKAKTRALEGGKPPGSSSPACTNAEVAAAIDVAIASSLPLAAAEARATARITRKCTDAQVAAGLFACNGAATAVDLAACVVAAAEEGACNAFELADGLVLDCPTPPVFP